MAFLIKIDGEWMVGNYYILWSVIICVNVSNIHFSDVEWTFSNVCDDDPK